MKNLFFIAVFFCLTIVMMAQTNSDPDLTDNFDLAPNGITCLCPNAALGETGDLVIGGITKIFTKRDRADIIALLDADENNPLIALTCTSGITDMSDLFRDRTTFNQDISSWDTSSVNNMGFMFRNSNFNQPLNNWNVSIVTNMRGMFDGLSGFDQPLNNWDVSNVTNMTFMFRSSNFNQPINIWDVSGVTHMNSMFEFASSFNQPLNDWDVSNVSNMSFMFSGATSFNQNISSWCVEFIFSEPTVFATNSALDNNASFKPVWGTCPPFVLASNGITCLCPNADLGETGDLIIGGITKTFTKRDRAGIIALLAIDSNDPDIAFTCTSDITDMSNLFNNRTAFNQDISSWDTSSVTDMNAMFPFSAFNQSINDWDVSNVTDMSSMFLVTNFNQALNNWDVSSVTDMSSMFDRASAFDQPLNNWDVSSVTDMSSMFLSATAFNQPLNNWDVSNVTDMSSMFLSASAFNQPINNWDVSSVTNMSLMFSDTNFSQPINAWDTSSVTHMNFMFRKSNFNQPLNDWDVSNVTDMSVMFRDSNFNQPLNNWDVSSVVNMNSMFFESNYNQPLNDWDVSSVTDMSFMFLDATAFNQDISSWCVENISIEPTNFTVNSPLDSNASFKPNWGTCPPFVLASNGVTCLCPNAAIGESGDLVIGGITKTFTKRDRAGIIALLDADENNPQIALTCTSGITDMSTLFQIRTTFNQDISSWDTSSVTDMSFMFIGDDPFLGPPTAFDQPINDWDVSSVTDMNSMFRNSNFNQPLNDWNVSSVTDMNAMFSNSNFNQPLNNWVVSHVTNMSAMFSSSNFNQPINNWVVSNVTNMSGMFNSSNFNQPLNDWDVSAVTDMRLMFNFASVFDQPINAWNVSNVLNMSGMFIGTNFNQPLNDWNVSSVTDMNAMFAFSSYNQPLDNWVVSNVTDMSFMFEGASAFDQPLNIWDVSSVTDMRSMFFGATAFSQDISSWCVENILAEPTNFATNSPLVSNPTSQPVWGTCPRFILADNGVTCLCPNAALGETGDLVIGGITKTFTKRDRAGIIALLNADENNPQIALTCTSGITDMSNLFRDRTSFNQDISSWDTSSVIFMNAMFRFSSFNQPVNDWDVSSVTNMVGMFRNTNFDQPLNDWDVSSVTNMRRMFQFSTFNQPINNWDVSNVTDMSFMFRISTFNQPLNDWDVSSVTGMSDMFWNATVFNQDISNWCVANILSEPLDFAISSGLFSEFKPRWGEACTDATWQGNVDANWNNPNNWEPNAIPIAGDNIAINSKAFQPIIDMATTIDVNNVILLDGNTLDVSGVLKVGNLFHNNGNIIFKSDANGSGQFDTFNQSISGRGSVTAERFIPAGLPDLRRAFRFLTTSVNSTGSINANWQEGVNNTGTNFPTDNQNPNSGFGTHITGGLASDGFDQNETGTASMFTFDNSNQNVTVTQDDDWYTLPNTNSKTLKAGEAYLTFIRGDRGIDVTSNSATPTNTTLRASGDLHVGPREFSSANNSTTPEYGLSNQADFYSLVGNPYQAIVDINNLDFTNVKSNFYWVWDPNLGSQGQYTTVSLPSGLNNTTSSANQFVQPGQSFFVQTIADGASSLTYNEDDKNTSGGATSIFSEQNEPSIQLLLYTTIAFNSGAKESDGALINFSDNANNGLDLFDADKFLGPEENLARLHSNELISIENRAMPTDNEILALSTTGYTEDNYTFVVNASNIQSNFEAYVLDNYTGGQTLLNEGATQINFSVDANIPESIAADRFNLVFDNTTLGINENSFGADFSLYPNPTKDGYFSIRTPYLSGEVTINLNNMLGQIIMNENLTIVGNEVNLKAKGLSTGVYIVKLTQAEQTFSTKLIVE